MTVKNLIKILSTANQNAKVTIVVWDYDNNIIDTSSFEVHGTDRQEYIELFVFY